MNECLRIGKAALAAIVATTGCDAVRVEQFERGADGRSMERPQGGELVAFGPAALSGAPLEQTTRAAVAGLGDTPEGIDAATRLVVELEAAVCATSAQGRAALGCAALPFEADAAVMNGRGRFGGVVAVRGVPHPAQLARLVAETPFMALVGDGAVALAGGATPYAASPLLPSRVPGAAQPLGAGPSPPPVQAAAARAAGNVPAAAQQDAAAPAAAAAPDSPGPPTRAGAPLSAGPRRLPAVPLTVGAMGGYGVVLRLGEHDFAAAVSTAGAMRMPRGRLTAVAVIGAAVFAGPEGAVAATGDPSHLIRNQLARQVYQLMLGGSSPEEAASWAAKTAPQGTTVQVVAVNRTSSHAASNRRNHAVTLSFTQSPGEAPVTVEPAP